jgi:hypothetical protein
MKTKHTATYQGHTWDRVSESRKYTHMVVVVESIAAQRAKVEKDARRVYEASLGYYTQMAAGGTYHGTFANGAAWSRPITDTERDAARHKIEAGVEGAVADALRTFDQRMQGAWKTEDGLSTVYSAGWCSRPDLAVKLAAKTLGGVIVEAGVQS